MSEVDFKNCLENELNPEQRRAVETLDGPVLVLAGAGSGKTRVIAYRTANLVYTGTCKPYEILAVTFTNKAADEMRARINRMVGEKSHDINLGTFHRICAQILRRYGMEIGVPVEFAILDDTESAILVKRCQKSIGIDPNHFDSKSIANAISDAKSRLITWKEYQEHASDKWETIVGSVYEKYQEALEHAKSLDFDDLIMKAVELLEQSPRTLKRIQDRFRYILVDEYQDINRAQYVFISTIAQRDKNICVVGDDDQSIYAFRGADPKYILSFEDDFPGSVIIKLEENYRSIPNILNVANALVSNNPKRHYKNLWTNRKEGEPVSFKFTENDEAEAIFVADMIETLMKTEDCRYSDFAVLYRTNSISRIFEQVFSQYAIPYAIIGGFRFYERKEVKDIIAYLKLVQNPWDTISLQRIINTPSRGIGEKSFTQLIQLLSQYNLGVHELADRIDLWPYLGSYASTRVIKFCEMIRNLHEEKDSFSVFELTGLILDETGYMKKLEESETIEAESRIENIEELLGAITDFDEAYPTEGLPVFLEQVALIQETDTLDAKSDSVKCLTVHNAKGLEFRYVFLVGMEDGLFPHSRSLHEPSGLEEERRLAYVGITRARDRLFLSAAYKRSSAFWRNRGNLGGSLPSRFLQEVPENLIEPLDYESSLALKGFVETPRQIKPEVRHLVESEYSQFGEGWTILPRAYEWASEQRKSFSSVNNSSSQTNSRKRKSEEPDKPSGYKVGEQVRHPVFGLGIVSRIQPAGGNDYFLQIDFETEGPKLLSEQKAPLEKID